MSCEHPDGDIMGSCAICGGMVCGECARPVFNVTICNEHGALEDEGAWELIGFYTSQAAVDTRKYILDEAGVAALVNEGDEDVSELYVPVDERDEAYAALSGNSEDSVECETCRVFYSPEMGVCPVCGIGTPADDALDEDDDEADGADGMDDEIAIDGDDLDAELDL